MIKTTKILQSVLMLLSLFLFLSLVGFPAQTETQVTFEDSTQPKVARQINLVTIFESDDDCTIQKVATEKDLYDVPAGHSFKSWAHYNLFKVGSKQWELQQIAATDENGFRKVGDAFCVALGTFYGNTIGDVYIISLDNGSVFEAVLCDVKSDRHTDEKHQYSLSNGCMIEFYVDAQKLAPDVKRRGNVSALPFFEGCVTSIEKIVDRNCLLNT